MSDTSKHRTVTELENVDTNTGNIQRWQHLLRKTPGSQRVTQAMIVCSQRDTFTIDNTPTRHSYVIADETEVSKREVNNRQYSILLY